MLTLLLFDAKLVFFIDNPKYQYAVFQKLNNISIQHRFKVNVHKFA